MKPWTEFTERSIGWRMRYEIRMKPSIDDTNDMSDNLDQITASIDAGLPVLGYFKAWDVGIAYGYEGTKLLVRDYWIKDEAGQIDIKECRGLFGFFEQREPVPTQIQSARFALAEAVSRWSHPADRFVRNGEDGAFHYGGDAYDRWTDLLARADTLTPAQQKSLLHVNYWTFISLHDARQKAAPYLRSIVELFPDSKDSLAHAAGLFQQIGEITGQVIHDGEIFPAFYQPDAMTKWTPDVRRREIELLKVVRALDQQAIASLARVT